MADPSIYSVLLAGGAGTRLWPVSRRRHPKQTARFAGEESLIQNTISRMMPITAPDNIRIVCGREHCDEISRHMAATGIPPAGKIIAEPCGRNTAPAILLALFHIAAVEPDAVICVFPADHVIQDNDEFREKVAAAAALARKGHIVTFGITPHYPETGYGYIEGGKEISHGALAVLRFVEKPDSGTAREYITAGNFFWNSGMFTFAASVMMAEFERHAPDLYARMAALFSKGKTPDEKEYGKMPDISIDYAVMEKTEKAVVLPVDFGWSDIGSWKSLFDFLPKDPANNVIQGDVMANRTKNSLILGTDRLIAVNHLDNVVVVDTPDAVFVSDMDNSRDVKSIVSRLKDEERKEFYCHRTENHPWGTDTLLEGAPAFTVSRLTVLPGQSVVFTLGKRMSGHFTVAVGSAVFSKNNTGRSLGRGETFDCFDPGEVAIENSGTDPVEIIRIACNKSATMGVP